VTGSRLALSILVALLLIGSASGCSSYEGSGTTTTGDAYYGEADVSDGDYEARQAEWENQSGEDWDLFNEGYGLGWSEGCDEAFSGSPDGYLYDQGEQFSADDCVANEPFDASEASDIPFDVS
jgi:hypothetical protein